MRYEAVSGRSTFTRAAVAAPLSLTRTEERPGACRSAQRRYRPASPTRAAPLRSLLYPFPENFAPGAEESQVARSRDFQKFYCHPDCPSLALSRSGSLRNGYRNRNDSLPPNELNLVNTGT